MIKEVLNNTLSKFARIKPTNLTLLVTNMCNARCVMCNIWQFGVSGETDLTLDQYKKILDNPLLGEVYQVTLSGGEALLRKDINELIDLILRLLPAIRRVFIATNGLASGPTVHKIEQILIRLQEFNPKKPCRLFVQVSYDGVSEVHDRIRGPNAHVRVTKTLERLIELRKKYSNLDLGAGCVVQPLNLTEAEQVKTFLKEKNIPCIFPIVCSNDDYYKNDSSEETISFSPDELIKVKMFYSRLVMEEKRPGRKLIYWDFLRILNGEESRRGCPAMRDTLVIEPDGNLMPCLNSGELSLGNVLKDDINNVWYSKDTKNTINKIQEEKCKTCMFACGASYLNGLNYYLWDSWRRTDLIES